MKRTILCLLLCASSLAAQTGAKNGEWRTYGGDLGNTHYSPLDQITAANFNNLQIAWRFKTDNLGSQPEYNLESTPLMANGILYSTEEDNDGACSAPQPLQSPSLGLPAGPTACRGQKEQASERRTCRDDEGRRLRRRIDPAACQHRSNC